MNIRDAFHQTVHGAPGGCEALAVRMGMSAQVLRNKANPNSVTNKPSLEEADRVMGLTGDYALLYALAGNHGHICTPDADDADTCDMAVLEMISKIWSASGEVGAEVHATLADGKVEPHEIARVEAAVYRVTHGLNQLVCRLKGMAEKPIPPTKKRRA